MLFKTASTFLGDSIYLTGEKKIKCYIKCRILGKIYQWLLLQVFQNKAANFKTKLRLWLADVWNVLHIGITFCYFSGGIAYYYSFLTKKLV